MRLQSVDYSSPRSLVGSVSRLASNKRRFGPFVDRLRGADEMLAIFRRSAVLMLAHAESFGLPICEAQACGCLIFTPDLNWTAAHWLGKDHYAKREPNCSSNFIVYENDPVLLAERLKTAGETFNPEQVRNTFLELQPELYMGDRTALADFLGKVEEGEISSELHHSHRHIGRPVPGGIHQEAVTDPRL